MNTYTDLQANSTASPSLSQPDPNQFKFKLTTTTASVGREEINWTVQVLGTTGACTGCSKVILRFVFFTPTGDSIDAGGIAYYFIFRSKNETHTTDSYSSV